ncbi:MAG: trigger factor, partial [bacterium]
MEIDVKSPKEWLREIEAEIEPERLKSRIEGLIEEYRDRAEVPGFRRGRVPKHIMERRFGSTLESAAVEEIVEQALSETLEKHSIKPASRVQFLNLEVSPDKTIRFRASVEVVPDFELQPYLGLNVKRPIPTGFDEEFEKKLLELREKCAHFQSVQRPAQNGDVVVVDYTILEKDKTLAGPKSNVRFKVGNDNNHPEINRVLLGVNPGDE